MATLLFFCVSHGAQWQTFDELSVSALQYCHLMADLEAAQCAITTVLSYDAYCTELFVSAVL